MTRFLRDFAPFAFSIVMLLLPNTSNAGLDQSLAAIASPILFFDNANDLQFRLQLIRSAGPQDRIRMATFLWEEGQTLPRLTQELCAASARGARVELNVDSKSASSQMGIDVFNISNDVFKAQERLQVLANCGVKISIHNDTFNYVKVLGKPMPNIFAEASYQGKTVLPFTYIGQISHLRERLVALLGPELRRLGCETEAQHIFSDLQGLAFAIRDVLDLAQVDHRNDENTLPFEQNIERLRAYYLSILRNPIWQKLEGSDMRALNQRLQEILRNDSELSVVASHLREYNRLNHRKIMLLDGKTRHCAILGGRNFGDHFLRNDADSYLDGDIAICNNHQGLPPEEWTKLEASLNELTRESLDPLAQGPSRNAKTNLIPPQSRFRYKYLSASETQPGPLPPLAPLQSSAIPGGLRLKNGWKSAEILTAAWDPAVDQIRKKLILAIHNEHTEVYLETPYAEFNMALRREIENALLRGVRVTIVTNSMMMSDGLSQMIRVWMNPWNQDLTRRFPKLYRTKMVPRSFGHMIHFKGAGFRSQRLYYIGSHNFHSRSGLSDKEIGIFWQESSDTSVDQDLISLRNQYYRDLSRKNGEEALVTNGDLLNELVSEINSDRVFESNFSRAIYRALYTESGTQDTYITEERRLNLLIQRMDQSGITDFIGAFF